MAVACSGARPSGSLERLEEAALHRLQSERQEWLADLDNLLEGNFAREDLELADSLARRVPPMGCIPPRAWCRRVTQPNL